MRRRRGGKSALGGWKYELVRQVRALAEHQIKLNPHPFLTHGELLHMIAPPEVCEVLTQARKLSSVSRYGVTSYVSVVLPRNLTPVMFTMLDGDNHPFLPRKTTWQDNVESLENQKKISDWASETLEIRFKWGLVLKLIDVLNNKLTSPAQVRYVWPAVLGIMRTTTVFDDLLPQIEEFKRPHNMPPISPELRGVCQECAQIVATGLILWGVEKPIAPDWQVAIELQNSGRTLVHPTCTEIGVYGPCPM